MSEQLKGQPSDRALRAARLWTDGSEVSARFWAQRLDNYTKELADENAALRERLAAVEPTHDATKERLLRGVHALAKGDTYEQDHLMQMLGGAMILSMAADEQPAAPQEEPHER